MLCLGLDTTSVFCSACVYDSERDKVISSISKNIGRGHSEQLLEIVDQALNASGKTYQDLDRIITGIGPGSFTGARVCVAAARGFALSLKVPAIGVSNFDAMLGFAKSKHGEKVKLASILEAGRGQLFCQFTFDCEFANANTPFICDIQTLKLSGTLTSQKALFSGLSKDAFLEMFDLEVETIDDADFSMIEEITKLGAKSNQLETRPEPLYLRSADAKPQHGFAVERVK